MRPSRQVLLRATGCACDHQSARDQRLEEPECVGLVPDRREEQNVMVCQQARHARAGDLANPTHTVGQAELPGEDSRPAKVVAVFLWAGHGESDFGIERRAVHGLPWAGPFRGSIRPAKSSRLGGA